MKKLKALRIDTELWQAAKVEAARRGITLQYLVAQALRTELGSRKDSLPRRKSLKEG